MQTIIKKHLLDIRGTLTTPTGKVVYQKVRAGLGNVQGANHKALQLRRHVIPLDPKTQAQLTRRALMRAAVTAWHSLTPTEKDAWRLRGHARAITGFNAWCGAYLRAGGTPPP